MTRIDVRELVGGLALLLVGVFVFAHSVSSYPLGTVQQMGSGMFPAALGAVLAVLGLSIALPALFRSGDPIQFEWRPFLVITVAGAAFALIVRQVGLIPSVVVVTGISVMARGQIRLRLLAILSVALCAVTYLVFDFALGLPVTLFNWPF